MKLLNTNFFSSKAWQRWFWFLAFYIISLACVGGAYFILRWLVNLFA